jgi:hypothetical protein
MSRREISYRVLVIYEGGSETLDVVASDTADAVIVAATLVRRKMARYLCYRRVISFEVM